jgi:hypothetical protein
MTVLAFIATAAPEQVGDLETAGKRVFAAVDAAAPEGFRYATGRLPDGRYLTLLEIADGTRNPLRDLPEYRDFEAGLAGWLAEPSTGGPVELIGSYRLFGPAAG